jgi:hypothetical protein
MTTKHCLSRRVWSAGSTRSAGPRQRSALVYGRAELPPEYLAAVRAPKCPCGKPQLRCDEGACGWCQARPMRGSDVLALELQALGVNLREARRTGATSRLELERWEVVARRVALELEGQCEDCAREAAREAVRHG